MNIYCLNEIRYSSSLFPRFNGSARFVVREMAGGVGRRVFVLLFLFFYDSHDRLPLAPLSKLSKHPSTQREEQQHRHL